MAAELFYLPFRPALDANALTVTGAKLYFYATGTTTPRTVYTTSALTTPLPNPVQANAAGVWPAIYLDDAYTYRVVLKDAAGATLSDVDPYLHSITDTLTTELEDIAVDVAADALAASTSATAASADADRAEAAQQAVTDFVATYAIYDTKAAADAALAGIPANGVIQVVADEGKAGARTIYRKTGGVLVFVGYANGTLPQFTFATRPDPAVYYGIMNIIITDARAGKAECYSDGVYWRRMVDGLIVRSAVMNYFADAVAGNDANAGTSAGAPVKTLAQLKTVIDALPAYRRSGLWIGFKRQAVKTAFSGMLDCNHANYGGCEFTDYGTGQYRPYFDASEVITNASITAHATISGAYEITLPVQPDIIASEIPRLYRDGICQSYVATEAGTSKSGTFWHPTPTGLTSLRFVFNPGTNPTSDGAEYRYARWAVSIHAFNAPETRFRDMVGVKPYTSYGSFIAGESDILRVSHEGCTVFDGNTHNLFVRRNGLMINCHAVNYHAGWGNAGSTAFIAFEQTPKPGDEFGFVRCTSKLTINTTKPASAITAVSQGATTTITTAEPHGIVNNDIVVLSGVGGATWLNGKYFRASNVSSTTVRLDLFNPTTELYGGYVSTGLAAWTSGGIIRLAPIENTASAGIGFYAHTGGVTNWTRGIIDRCTVQGASLAFSHANLDQMAYTSVRALQCYAGIKPASPCDWTVDDFYMENTPAIAGATVGSSGGINDFSRWTNIRAKLNSTGNIFIAHANATMSIDGYEATGIQSLVRCTQLGAVLDIRNVKSKPNPNLPILDTIWFSSATADISSDANDFGQDWIGAEVSASCGATGTCSAASGVTTITLAAVVGFVSPGDAIAGTNIPAGATLVRQLTGSVGGGGNWELSAATTGSIPGGTAFTVTSKQLHIWSITRGVLDNRILGWPISGPTLSGSPTISTYPTGNLADTTLRANEPDPLLSVAQQFAQQAVLIGKRLTFQAPGGSANQPFSVWQAAGYDLNSKL